MFPFKINSLYQPYEAKMANTMRKKYALHMLGRCRYFNTVVLIGSRPHIKSVTILKILLRGQKYYCIVDKSVIFWQQARRHDSPLEVLSWYASLLLALCISIFNFITIFLKYCILLKVTINPSVNKHIPLYFFPSFPPSHIVLQS